MPIYNRPQYLTQVLTALKDCQNLDKFYIETFEETASHKIGARRTHTIKINKSIFDKIDWIEIRRHINPGVKGCARNVIDAIDSVCKKNEFLVVLEDDLIPSTDFLNLMLFGFKNFDDKTVWIQSYSNTHVPSHREIYNQVSKCNFFACSGWGISSDLWIKYRKDFIRPLSEKGSWAIPFSIWLIKKGYQGYQCMVDRIQNIGKVGAFTSSETYKKHHRDDWYGIVNIPITKFEIINECNIDPPRTAIYSNGIVSGLNYRTCFKNWRHI